MRTLLTPVCAALILTACNPAPKARESADAPVVSRATSSTRAVRSWEAASDDARVATGGLFFFETDYPPANNPHTRAPLGASVRTSIFTSAEGHVITAVASGAR